MSITNEDELNADETVKTVTFQTPNENHRTKLPLASLTNGTTRRPPFLSLSSTSMSSEFEGEEATETSDDQPTNFPTFSKGVKLKLPSLELSDDTPAIGKLPTLTLPDRREDLKDSYHCESDIFEDIDVQLIFPGGDIRILRVKMGETVQGIKRHIDTNFGIPYSNTALYLEGKHMLDPLSLNDFPTIALKQASSIEVRVCVSISPKDEGLIVETYHTDNLELPGSVRGSVSSATGIRPIFDTSDIPTQVEQPEQPEEHQIDFAGDEQHPRRIKYCWLF